MSTLFKKPSGTYYAAFYCAERRPTRKQVSLRTKTKRTAEVLQRRLDDAWTLGEYDPWVEPDWTRRAQEGPSLELLDGAKAAFLTSRAHRSPYTLAKYDTVLGGLVAWLGPSYPSGAVTAADVGAYLYGRDRKAVTRKSYASALSAFFNWLARKGVCRVNPVAEVRLERVVEKHPRYLSAGDVEALCAVIASDGAQPRKGGGSGLWLLPVVRANVYLGLRAGELVHVRWEDVDLVARTLRVANTDAFTTKAGRERTLPLCRPVVDVLSGLERRAEWVFPNASAGQLHRKYLSRAFKRYARAAGLPDHVCFHTTRHTCASWLAERGAPVEAIRAYLGHSSVRVTERYMHLSPASLAAQVSAAFDA